MPQTSTPHETPLTSIKASLTTKMALITTISVLLLFIAWLLSVKIQPEKNDIVYVSIIVEAFKTIGATGLAIVLLNFWIETDEWVEYMKKQLRSIVIDQNYMQGLDEQALEKKPTLCLT